MGFVRFEEELPLAIGWDAVDLSVVAGGDVEVALGVEDHRPDVLSLGVVEDFGLAVGGEAVDFAVGRRGKVHAVPGVDGDGVDFERVEFGDDFSFAARRDHEELGVGAAAGVEVAFGVAGEGPEVGGRAVEEFAGAGGEGEGAVAAHGEVFGDAFFEVGVVGLGPGAGLAGEEGEGEDEERAGYAQGQE